MTDAMQTITQILSQVRMTEQDTLAIKSKSNCVYRLLTFFQVLLLFPCFQIQNVWRKQQYGMMIPDPCP